MNIDFNTVFLKKRIIGLSPVHKACSLSRCGIGGNQLNDCLSDLPFLAGRRTIVEIRPNNAYLKSVLDVGFIFSLGGTRNSLMNSFKLAWPRTTFALAQGILGYFDTKTAFSKDNIRRWRVWLFRF